MTAVRLTKWEVLLVGLAGLLAALLGTSQLSRGQGASASVITLKRADYQKQKQVEKKVKLHPGETRTFWLEFSSGSGYWWEASRKGDEVGELSRKPARKVVAESPGRPRYGSAWYAVYEFKATKVGKATLEFQLRRSGAKAPEATLQVEVDVSRAND